MAGLDDPFALRADALSVRVSEYDEDCSEGYNEDDYYLTKGVYYTQPSPTQPPFRTFCDMRLRGRSRIMAKGTFWIGNELLHHVTNSRRQTLIIEATIPELGYRQYFYYGFVVKSEEEGYAFTYDRGGPSNDHPLGDILLVNGTKFSTYDVDNDLSADNCADIHKSGWWFTTCGGYNPTGQPQPLSDQFMSSDPTSLSWPIAGNLSIPYLRMFLTNGLVERHG
ncbi:fibrinogen-like protein 1 [Haliotis rubra]|uniref:fibrinogen-like protein 1 n=1 Tax=Haliotis rubra TaxID=36100 RepID=UPI001EE50676|nr:fibrinogen-like protein 1 [Haliotis rubra]